MSNVIDMFSRPAKEEKKTKSEGEYDFESVIAKNKRTQQRDKERRENYNDKTKRRYRLDR